MTEREQLIEMRKEIILFKLEGITESEKARATRNLDRMEFTDHADFMEYVGEITAGTPANSTVKEATDEEMDAIAEQLGFGKSKSDNQASIDDKLMDDVFKHLNI